MIHKKRSEGEGMLLCGTDFYLTYPWEWRRLKPATLSKCNIGALIIEELVPTAVYVMPESPSLAHSASMQQFCSIIGLCHQARFMHDQLSSHVATMLETYDFSEDGMVSFAGRHPYELHIQVNAHFNSIVMIAKQLIDRMDSNLKKYVGKNAYDQWKEMARDFFQTIPYSFCYEFRDCVEHETAAISIVNVDVERQAAGFAINIEGDILQLDMKSEVKSRLVEFAERRKSKGQSPWLSVGHLVRSYYDAVSALFAMYMEDMIEVGRGYEFDYLKVLESIPANANCVVREMPLLKGMRGKRAQHVYQLFSVDELEELSQWLSGFVDEHIDE